MTLQIRLVGWAKARAFRLETRGQNRARAVPTRQRFERRFCPPYRLIEKEPVS